MRSYQSLKKPAGFTLLELTLVLSIISLLSFVVVSASVSVIHDYRLRLAFRQGMDDLKILEVARKSGITSSAVDKQQLLLANPSAQQLLSRLAPTNDWSETQKYQPQYEITAERSSVKMTFAADDVANLAVKGAEKSYQQLDAKTKVGIYQFYSRDADSMVMNYLAPAAEQKQASGW